MTLKPLELKSPDNALALGCYLLTAVLGASFIAGGATSPGLTLLLSAAYVPVWALLMVLSGVIGVSAAWVCPHSVSPVRWLRVERVGAAGVALAWATYAYAAQLTPGHSNVGLIAFGLQALQQVARCAQISVELHRLRLAIAEPVVTVSVKSFVDPRDHS